MSERRESRAHSLLFKAVGVVGKGASEQPIRMTVFDQPGATAPAAVLRVGSGTSATQHRGRLHGLAEGGGRLALSCVVARGRADGAPVYADVLRVHLRDGALVGELLPGRIAALVDLLRDPQRTTGISEKDADDAVQTLMRTHGEGVDMAIRFMAPGVALRGVNGASSGLRSSGGLRHG